MKKLENKTLKEKTEKTTSDEINTMACDCCDLDSASASKPSQDGQKQYEQEKSHGEHNNWNFDDPKLLIIIGLAFTIPIVLFEFTQIYYPVIDYVALALATLVQLTLGRPFYIRFYKMVTRQRRGFTTDTLVVLSTTIAYVYSVVLLFTGADLRFFEASSSVLTIFTIGEYLEGRILKTTTESIKNLLALKPKTALVIRNGKEKEIDAESIIIGDIVVTKPGEKIATDGRVVFGQTFIDESMITGESIPVDKIVGDNVIGGTINKNGYIQFKALAVGRQTVLASIIELVKKARLSKAPVQRIADKAVKYFIPVVIFIALASSLFWFFVGNQSISFAITVFATVLVVSCPCALGIATPMVISLGIDKAAREGILVKGGQYIEMLSSIDTIVFDKTGTLTNGKPVVTDVIPNDGYNEFELLQLAFSVEMKSEHPIAQAIVRRAKQESIPKLAVSDFNSISGSGVVAFYSEKRILVSNPRTCDTNSINEIIPQNLQKKLLDLETAGKSVVTVYFESKLIGLIAVADELRDNAKYVVDEIKKMSMETILLTGDNQVVAEAVAKKLGIKKVFAQVSPDKKADIIKRLQNQGKKVAMIGDGINDAPAITQSNIGIAMGTGTDVAVSSGDIILMKGDLRYVLSAFEIGKYSIKKIKQNLAISFAYNVITIAIAAGLFYSMTNSLILTPAIAALGWVISDSAVFGNSLLIRKYVPYVHTKSK